MADPTPSVILWTDIAQAIGIMVTAGLVALGLILAFFQIRVTDKAREVEALTARSQKWEEPPLVEARLAVATIGDALQLWNKLDAIEPGKSQDWYLYIRIPHFFEDLGVACLHTKALNKKMVYELFAPSIALYWDYYRTFIEEFRKKQDDRRLFEWWEKLATEISQIKQKRPH